MNEKKRKQIEWTVKIIGLLVVGFVIQPFVFLAIQGIAGLIVGIAIAALTVTFLPWVAMKLANWKLKALKWEASKNPIETLENEYKEREAGLIEFREHIKTFHAEVQSFYDEFSDYKEQYPTESKTIEDQYIKMKKLLDLRSKKYVQAQKNLKIFSEVIEQKRAQWKIAQSAAKMSKAAGIGEDFISKLVTDTAVISVQTDLNNAFAELEVSLLDEQQDVAENTNSTPQNLLAPPTLDLVFDTISTKEKVKA